jgi:hypothetical protein
VQSRPLQPLRKDHLERMRPARRLRHVQSRPAAAMHLQPNGRGARTEVPLEPKLKHLRHVGERLRRE